MNGMRVRQFMAALRIVRTNDANWIAARFSSLLIAFSTRPSILNFIDLGLEIRLV